MTCILYSKLKSMGISIALTSEQIQSVNVTQRRIVQSGRMIREVKGDPPNRWLWEKRALWLRHESCFQQLPSSFNVEPNQTECCLCECFVAMVCKYDK